MRRKVISLKRLPDFDNENTFLCSVKHGKPRPLISDLNFKEPIPMCQAYTKPNVLQLYSVKEHHRACSGAFYTGLDSSWTLCWFCWLYSGFLSSFEERCFESPELLVLNLLSNKLLVGESLVISGHFSNLPDFVTQTSSIPNNWLLQVQLSQWMCLLYCSRRLLMGCRSINIQQAHCTWFRPHLWWARHISPSHSSRSSYSIRGTNNRSLWRLIFE